ncbi:MAG: DUF445 family protein, partial [Gemmatimonadales bacterium]|nr:DUF445 family protein [Gemmatimonadales bacterium]
SSPSMDPQTVLTGIITVLVGSLSGGLTNAVAIWMLFHPYERRGPGPFKIHGAIPKNKARLAKSIGKTVGQKLLTAEDLARRLSAPEIEQAFTAALDGILNDLLEADRGPLKDHLSPEMAESIDLAVGAVGEKVSNRLVEYARTPEFATLMGGWIQKLQDEVGHRPIAEILTAERRETLRTKVDEWVRQLADGPELERTLRHFVDTQLDRLADDTEPLIERLPPGLVGTVEQGITDYLPVALERIGGVLADPEAKGRVRVALRQAFDGSIRDLLLHERLLAKIVVTDSTFTRLLDGIERDGFERFASTMTSPEMREQFSKAVNAAIVNFLRIPLSERFTRLGPERRASLAQTLGDWLVRVARDESTQSVIARTVDRALAAAEQRTWADVLHVLPAERIGQLLGDSLATDQARGWVQEATQSVANQLLSRPLGRPATWLGTDTTEALRQGLSGAAWGWTRQQVPRIVEQFSVQETVERKVLGFSTERMEQIVRGVTQRELTWIVRIGYMLGAMIGLIAFLANQLLG